MDPITLDATDADLSSTKATMGSHTDDAVYVSAHTMLFGPSSLFVTDDGVHDGDPCASSTRKNDQVANDLPAQSNKGSDDATLAEETKEKPKLSLLSN